MIHFLSICGPLKLNKTGNSVYNALKSLIETHKPQKFETDEGGEFLNKKFQRFLAANGVDHYSVSSDRKCAIVERANRTLRMRMSRAFTALGKPRWVDILDDLVNGYNNSYHRSIKMRPVDVTKENEKKVRKILYPPRPKKRPPNNTCTHMCRSGQLSNTARFNITMGSFVVGTNYSEIQAIELSPCVKLLLMNGRYICYMYVMSARRYLCLSISRYGPPH